MVDTGCLCSAVIDVSLVRTHQLLTENIRPRYLKLADDSSSIKITRIAKLSLDFDGHNEQLWSYIMPNLVYPIILGKPWMEKNRVVYAAGDQFLIVQPGKEKWLMKANRWVKRDILHARPGSMEGLREGVLNTLETEQNITFPVNRSKDSTAEEWMGAISIHSLSKALETKVPMSKKEVEDTLPKEIANFADLFLEDGVSKGSILPPHRSGVDTRILMQKTSEGRDMEVPWGPQYGMSREELLVLRKTLTELLDKNWIRTSSSPGEAPVLFIKKPGDGLRFCVDYRALNAVSERDRYPLPLIQEAMQMLAGATWLTKVDVRAAFHRLKIGEGDEWKTAFRTRLGSFEWLVTPFGLAGTSGFSAMDQQGARRFVRSDVLSIGGRYSDFHQRGHRGPLEKSRGGSPATAKSGPETGPEEVRVC
ncbi:hypothetical protein K3495_g12974 [Podosphaera aphanis]|nr:hypothetical protein K3495_g12974 [Podosphaera aphanis]